GRLRNSAAMRTNGSTSAPGFPTRPSLRAIICSSARFNCSIFLLSPFPGFRERLGIRTLHTRPQTGQGPELQLFHRAFSLANLPRHFFDAFLFHEPHYIDFFLLRRQTLNEAEERRPALDGLDVRRTDLRLIDRRVVRNLASRSLVTVGDQIRCDPEQPRRKRNPTPLESLQIRQRLLKGL